MKLTALLAVASMSACMVSTGPGVSGPAPVRESRPAPPPNGPPARPMPPPPTPYVFNSNGWTLLAERSVDGKLDADRIDISQKQGKFGTLTVVVLDSDLEMIDFRVQFVSGKAFDPEVRQVFNEGTRTRLIQLPSADPMRLIEFKYKNLPGGGRARVQVWGR